jgi:hypothetical protein
MVRQLFMIFKILPLILYCSETTLTEESWFHIVPPLGLNPGPSWWEANGWTTGTVCKCSEITGSPQGSPPAANYVGCEAGRRTCSERETGTGKLCEIKWGLAHCWHDSLVTVHDKACHRRGQNDQSRRDHQCSETTLTGEARFHISTPLGIEPGSLMTGSKLVNHWTSGTVCECSEIAGSPQYWINKFFTA